MAKRSQAERAAIGGKARAQKLSPERRREIAMKGARASMAKARGEYTPQPRRPDAIAALAEKNAAGRSEETEARAAILLDPVDWIYHYLRNPETRQPFEMYPEQITFLREGFTPDPETMRLKYDEVVFSAPKKAGKCLGKDELLTLADGRVVTAGSLIGKSFSVPTLDQSGRCVSANARAEFNAFEPVYRLTTDSGWSVVRNAEHPFYVGTRRKPWKESIVARGFDPLSQLKPGDLIAVSEEVPVFGEAELLDEEVKLLAHMIADGTCDHCLYTKPPGLQMEEVSGCAKAIGCDIVRVDEINVRIVGDGTRKVRRVANSRGGVVTHQVNPLRELLRSFGLHDKRSEEKFIPDIVYSLPKRQVAMFLSRLFGGDGWACTSDTGSGIRPEIGYSSASKALVLGMRLLLSRFGIHVRYRVKKTKCNGKECLDAHCLAINRAEDVLRFADEIGMYGKEEALAGAVDAAKARKPYDWIYYKAPPGCRWEKIESIEPAGQQATVAIEVPGYETFVTPLYEHNSALASMVLLYVICALGGDRAEGYIVSNSREQASDRIFNDCTAILKCSPELSANPRNDVIEFPQLDAFIKTVTTEAKSAAGPRPTIVVGDEIWGFTNEAAIRLWDEMAPTPTVPVSVRLITTYAGFTGESNLLEGYYRRIFAEDGSLQEGVKQVGTDLYAKGRTLVYWTHAWRAPWQTPEWIDTMRQAYANRPNQFARIMENRWVSSESSFIEAEQWGRCVDAKYRPARQATHLHVWSAVDASVRKDSTAIVTVALDCKEVSEEVSELKAQLEEVRMARYPHPNPLMEMMAAIPWQVDYEDTTPPMTLKDLRLRVVDHKIIIPRAGSAINFAEVENYIISLSRRYHLELVAFDPYQMVAVAQGLSRFGIPMYEMQQTHSNISGFTELLSDLISQERLRVYPADDLKQHVLNCVAKESDRGRHIVKKGRSQKIDAAVALAMASFACARSFSVAEEPAQDQSPVGGDIYAV